MTPNFVGREKAIADLSHLVNWGARLILIQGEGGLGKTTLARKYLDTQGFDVQLELWLPTEPENITPVESVVEEWLRGNLNEETEQDFGINLERLRRKLRDPNQRIGVLIDNLESALNGEGRFIDIRRPYVDLLRVLADSSVRSVTLITSRERLYEASVSVQHYRPNNLNEEDWRQFFSSRQIRAESGVLSDMWRSYGGNAKAMKILSGAILSDSEGDIEAYWQESRDDLLIEQELSHLVDSQFARLQLVDPDVYQLLCLMGCYYQETDKVQVAALLNLLWDVPKNKKRQVVSRLQNSSLVEFSDGKCWLHPVIRAQAIIRFESTEAWRIAERNASHLESCAAIGDIGQAYQSIVASSFESPSDSLYRSFNRISEDVEVALNQTSTYNQRLVLTAVSDRLDGLLRELIRSSDKYAVRFYPIAQHWSHIVAFYLADLAKAAELRQEIDSPYIIGIPLTERQEIFVGRTDISRRMEQLLLDRRSPPLLLYGQRRTGKTSLLNNLGRLLPNSIIPMFVDLQGPASRASDHAGFLYNLAKGMTDSAKRQRSLILPPLSRESLTDDPFTRFDEWLDQVEATLQDTTALLALDEFEVLDQVLGEGRFSETAILGMLRNLIQHRLRFKVLLSGSHALGEFQRWSSYLINAQVLHLGYLNAAEARQLVEQPVEGFALRYEPDACQRVLDLTQGHPFLVQLLCAEIVALKNEQDPKVRRLATLVDVETAIPEALSSGSMFFSDIERNQVNAHALPVLRYLAAQGEGATVSQTALFSQFSDSWAEAIHLLLRRELIELNLNGYRFQVELIRRWFTA